MVVFIYAISGTLFAQLPQNAQQTKSGLSVHRVTRHPNAVLETECFPVERLAVKTGEFSRQMLLDALDSEALYTMVGGFKPVSEGFGSEYFQVAPPDLRNLEQARDAMKVWRCGECYQAGTLVFERLREGERYGSAWISNRSALKNKIQHSADFFGGLGITDESNPEVILLSIERAKQAAERWRGFGLLFGYPKDAIDFFVKAGEHQAATGEFVHRDFRSYPTQSSANHNFVYAVARMSIESAFEKELRRRVESVLTVYRAHRDRYIEDDDPRRVVQPIRDWFGDGSGWCHPDHALQKATMWDAARQWAASNGIKLRTTCPNGPLDDLRQLDKFLEDPRIVALGESTHGTREFFQIKHRVFRHLVENHGVRLFGIEASYAACLAIDDYVVNGNGDPRTAIKGQGFWTWDTEEVLALIQWMRDWNVRRPRDELPLRFYGFDTQDAFSPLNIVLSELRQYAPEQAADIRKRLSLALTEQYGDSLDSASRPQLDAALQAIRQLSDFALDLEEAPSLQRRQWELLLLQASSAIRIYRSRLDRYSSIGMMAEVDLYSRIREKISRIDGWASNLNGEEAVLLRSFIRAAADLKQCQLRFRDNMTEAERDSWRDAVQWGTTVADSEERKATLNDLHQFLQVSTEYLQKPRQLANVRDESMALMVERILRQHGTGSRIALWAHDWHISKFEGDPAKDIPRMGTYLHRRFGKDYLPVGLSFGAGGFQAKYHPLKDEDPARAVLREFKVDGSRYDSFSNVFDYCDAPASAFALQAEAVDFLPAWIGEPHFNRTIGAVFQPQLKKSASYYEEMILGEHYELVIHIRKTMRARPLGPVSRFRFGAKLAEAAAAESQGLANQPSAGVLVESVTPNSIAERCGLRARDRIIRLGVQSIDTTEDFQQALADIDRPGSHVMHVHRIDPQAGAAEEQEIVLYLVAPPWLAE